MVDILRPTEIRKLPFVDRLNLFKEEASKLIEEAHQDDRADFERLIVVCGRFYSIPTPEGARIIGLERSRVRDRIDNRGNRDSWRPLEDLNVIEALYFANELGKNINN